MKQIMWCLQEKEKGSWEAASQAFKTKLEITESNCIRAEIEAAKMRSINCFREYRCNFKLLLMCKKMKIHFSCWIGQLELEASVQTQMLSTREAELAAAKEEVLNYICNSFIQLVFSAIYILILLHYQRKM